MCYIILARSIKRGFKTGVNLLRQVCTFVLSPFFMQKCDGIRHNYYLIQTERTVNFMTNVTSVSINSMSDIFSNMNADFEISAMPETMLVVTNANKTGGASLILDDNVRQRVSELYGGNDFFVIPSSIHEVITLPVGNTILSPASTFSPFQPDSETLQSIMEMVSEVNETLEDEEILGYSVSIYDADKHELEKGTEYCINKQIDKVRNLRINELKEMGEIQPDIKPDNDNPKL